MKNLSFVSLNTKTYNTFLCIILPLATIALLYPYASFLLNVKTEWLFSTEFLRLTVIIICYTVPLTYVLAKTYEIVASGADKSKANTILAFIACCILILPLVFIGLVVLAKISFFIPIAFTAVIIFIYSRSYKPVTL